MATGKSQWACPRCRRRFTRANQRHACRPADAADVTRNRAPALVALYRRIEAFARSLGPIEVVTGDRYVLFRSRRIFTDLVIMTDAVRIAVHLERKVADPMFIKVVADRRHVTHVAKLHSPTDFEKLKPRLAQAYQFSLR